MSAHQLAQGVASLGRNNESMLVHMQPREVAGLQALAMQHGGTLTTNPETGLPEAGWFGDILGAVAPIAVGALLGPAGMGLASSALGAGMMTGAIGFLASGGDLASGLSAGLGGAGGFGLTDSLGKVGQTALVNNVANPATVGNSILEGGAGSFSTGADSLTSLAGNADNLVGKVAGAGLDMTGNAASNIPGMGIRDLGNSAMNLSGTTANVASTPYTWGDVGKGAMQVGKDPIGAWKAGQIGAMDALTVASPFMAIQPKTPKAPEDTSYKMKYEGPYTAQDRSPRTPTPEEMTQLAAQGSPEYSYFGDSNPYPGFNKAPGYAQGGVANLYSSPDGTPAQNTLNESYGLGRLNNLSSAASTESAKGMGFDAGGVVPMGAQASTPSGLSNLLGNAITDPMGRTVQSQPTLHAAGGGLRDGGFVVPADVVSHLGNGSTDAGLALLQKRHGAQSIRGAGDGMSDSIKTTIEGKQPARVADGEAYIPPEEVKRSGGSKKWYDKMDKIRKARTGTTKQGKQINPNSFLPV